MNGSQLYETLAEIKQYFIGCMQNAQPGSAARIKFLRYIEALQNCMSALEEENED